MYCEDLSAYHYSLETGIPGVLSVGWLGEDRPFTTGRVSAAIATLIRQFADTPILLTRGFHECHLCEGTSPAIGNGEFWLHAETGPIYAVPSLLPHYIEGHHYRPPDEFLSLFDSAVEAVPENQCKQLMQRQAERLRNDPSRDDILVELFDTQVFWRSDCFPDLLAFGGHLETIKDHGPHISTDSLSRRREGFSLNIECRSPADLFSDIASRYEDSSLAPYMYRYRLVYLKKPWTVVERRRSGCAGLELISDVNPSSRPA